MTLETLCPSCGMEAAGSESSRKIQDKEETTSEASWTAVTTEKKKRCGGWNWRVKRKGTVRESGR